MIYLALAAESEAAGVAPALVAQTLEVPEVLDAGIDALRLDDEAGVDIAFGRLCSGGCVAAGSRHFVFAVKSSPTPT